MSNSAAVPRTPRTPRTPEQEKAHEEAKAKNLQVLEDYLKELMDKRGVKPEPIRRD